MISSIIQNKEFFAVIVSFLGVLFPIYQYFNSKRREQNQKNFEDFHEQIRKISNTSGVVGIDEQVAVIFALRKFPDYYPVSKRILKNLEQVWKRDLQEKPQFQWLLNEAEETAQYIDLNQNYFKRKWTSIKERYF